VPEIRLGLSLGFRLTVESVHFGANRVTCILRGDRFSAAADAAPANALVDEIHVDVTTNGRLIDDFDGVAQLVTERSDQFAAALGGIDGYEHEPVRTRAANTYEAGVNTVVAVSTPFPLSSSPTEAGNGGENWHRLNSPKENCGPVLAGPLGLQSARPCHDHEPRSLGNGRTGLPRGGGASP
jgi:hypothetical protein